MWNIAKLFFIFSFGVEVVEIIEYDFGLDPIQDMLVIATVAMQNLSLWVYLKNRPDLGFWSTILAIGMAVTSVSVTSAVVHHAPTGWFDAVMTLVGLGFLNVMLLIHDWYHQI
jgi:uncharacterized membrane protein